MTYSSWAPKRSALWQAARRSPFQLTQRLRLATEHPTLNSRPQRRRCLSAPVQPQLGMEANRTRRYLRYRKRTAQLTERRRRQSSARRAEEPPRRRVRQRQRPSSGRQRRQRPCCRQRNPPAPNGRRLDHDDVGPSDNNDNDPRRFNNDDNHDAASNQARCTDGRDCHRPGACGHRSVVAHAAWRRRQSDHVLHDHVVRLWGGSNLVEVLIHCDESDRDRTYERHDLHVRGRGHQRGRTEC